MPISKTAQIDREERRRLVSDMYRRGVLQTDIAKEVGIDQATVSRDLKAIRAEWLESRVRDFDAAKEVELQKIDEVERQAWAGWERSVGVVERKTKRSRTKGSEKEHEATIVEIQQAGDSRFLKTVLDCIERRCKIMGLDAPEKFAETDSQGRDIDRKDREERVASMASQLLEQRQRLNGNGSLN